ncbi:MAG: class II aldolase/adducin family protein [Candidatus Thermoplasmatota archaeon]
MLNKNPEMLFQTFFVSQEVCNCPLVVEMIKLEKKITEKITDKDEQWCISCNYGKRMLITTDDKDKNNIKQEDIVEVVDYDPFKNIILVIGRKIPCKETPIHWMIQKARPDINFIVEIFDKKIYEKNCTRCVMTKKETKDNTIDRVKDILKLLQKQKTVLIKNQGVIITGFNRTEIEKILELL